MADVPPTPPETLRRAREIARRNGLCYAYTGNVRDDAGSTTYCPGCGATLVVRRAYFVSDWELDDSGRCLQCGTATPGVFESLPGDWSGIRVPVRLPIPGLLDGDRS